MFGMCVRVCLCIEKILPLKFRDFGKSVKTHLFLFTSNQMKMDSVALSVGGTAIERDVRKRTFRICSTMHVRVPLINV